MKRYTFILLACVLSLQSWADTETPVKSNITDVTVFLSGAQVTRTSKVTLRPGTNVLKFEDLSQYINANSIQVKGNKKFTILSVNHRNNYLRGAATPAEIAQVEDSVELVKFKIDFNNSMLEVFDAEKKMLLENKQIKGSEEGILVEDLQEFADYYRERMRDIEYKQLELNESTKQYNRTLKRLKNQLRELNYQRNNNTGEILVSVKADASLSADIQLSYVVTQAGWTPAYDVRSSDINGPVRLTYKAKVRQNSGNDWKNVNITLSTGNPSKNSTKPEISPWALSFEDYNRMAYASNAVLEVEEEEIDVMDDEVDHLEGGELSFFVPATETGADFTSKVQSNTTTEFNISIPYSIYTDNKEYDVEVQNHNLPATYSYFAAPKLDPDAFLLARITGWDNLNLLSGKANVYYQGTFVGTSYINTQTTQDTLDISLGRDPSVVITREKVKDYTSKTTVGSSTKVAHGWVIKVRNSKNKTVVVKLVDQIPLSKNRSIVVDAINTGEAAYNEENGRLEWKVILGPGETKEFQFRYEVKYPKEQSIRNL